jgi:DNA-binding transcriptional regulator PaaX
MKLPFTDKFLWVVYNFFEETGDVLEAAGVGWPSLHKLTPMDREFWSNLERKRSRKQFGQFVNYLKRNGYIQIANLKEKKGILLTQKGRQKALKTRIALDVSSNLKKRKDGKLLMVTFDIPEKKRPLREGFRKLLYSLGFQQLQKSVWYSSYDIQELLEETIRAYAIDPYVRIFVIEEVEV